jgi:PAS domain S-box-containing protein
LRVSSTAKRAVIRTENEGELYEEFCKALTDTGGYPLAYIALPEANEKKSVQIAASAGPGIDYLRTLDLTWSETPKGNGPVGTCIRCGQVVVINDAAHDQRFLPWRERAAQFGYASVVALPLLGPGKPVGAITIYAREPDAFYPEEISLLEELADDLSYGLELRSAREARSRAERAVLQAAAEFRTVFDSTNDAIFITSTDGRILEVNQAACRNLGYSRSELLTMTIPDIDMPESSAILPQRLAMLQEQGELCFETVQRRKDGTPVPIELNARVIQYHQAPALVGIARDVSERKRTEQQLRARTEDLARLKCEAETANRAKSEFLANMSHEIRTPLNGIIGFNRLLEETPLTAEQQEHNDAVRSSADHLLALVNDLLDFSRIEAGRMELDDVAFSLRACVEQAVNPVKPLAAAKGLAITVEMADDLPSWVRGDPHRLRQILLNLLGNAVKFTEEGRVTLSVSANDGEEAPDLRFAVSDTGIGIPAARRAFIFEPFRQADGSITRRFGGTGLGLTISRRLVAMMKGSMWLESREGVGSTFSFRVPLTKADAPAPASGRNASQAPVPAANRGMTILVAEDNKINQRLIRRILEVRGHHVMVCDSGAAVLDALALQSFDLVLMDVHMPEMDGLQATMCIREREQKTGGRLPIVAMTASAMAGDREQGMAAGFDAYLTKPVDFEELEQVLDRYSRNQT